LIINVSLEYVYSCNAIENSALRLYTKVRIQKIGLNVVEIILARVSQA